MAVFYYKAPALSPLGSDFRPPGRSSGARQSFCADQNHPANSSYDEHGHSLESIPEGEQHLYFRQRSSATDLSCVVAQAPPTRSGYCERLQSVGQEGPLPTVKVA